MSKNIGRVDFIVALDGSALPREARRIGKTAAGEFKDGFQKGNKNFFDDAFSESGKRLSRKMRKNGALDANLYLNARSKVIRNRASSIADELAEAFTLKGGLDKVAKRYGGVDAAVKHLSDSLVEARDETIIDTRTFNAHVKALGAWSKKVVALNKKNDQFNESLRKLGANRGLEKLSSELDSLFGKRDEFNKMSASLDRIGRSEAFDKLNASLDRMGKKKENVRLMTEETGSLNASLKRIKFAEFEKRMGSVFDNMDIGREKTGRLSSAFHGLGAAIKGSKKNREGFLHFLTHGNIGMKLLIGLIISGSSDIAALGSAAGSSLTLLATSLLSLAPAVAVLLVGFKGILGDVGKMPAEIRPAARAFQGLTAQFKEMAGPIRKALLVGLEGPIERVTKKLLPVLQRGLVDTGKTLNGVFKDLSDSLTSKNGLESMQKLLRGFQPILKSLGHAAIKLGGALGNIFVAALPSTQKFADGLDDLITKFDNWTQSVEGQHALSDFFRHGQEIMKPVLRLAGTLGNTLSNLVTDKSVKRLVDFVDELNSFLPTLGKLLDVVSKLDLIGLLTKALDEFGKVMKPLIGPLGDLAEALSRVASIMIKEWGKALSGISSDLAPVISGIADFLDSLDPKAVRGFADALLAVAAAAIVLKGAKGLSGLVGSLSTLGKSFVKTSKKSDKLYKKMGKLKDRAGAVAAGLAGAFTGASIGGSLSTDPAWSNIGKIAGGIMGGAMAGTMFGPGGVVIGAIAGLMVGSLMTVDWKGVWDSVFSNETSLSALRNAVSLGPVAGIVQVIKTGLNNPETLAGVGQGIVTVMGRAFMQVQTTAGTMLNTVVTFFFELPGRLLIALGNIGLFLGRAFDTLGTYISTVIIPAVLAFMRSLPGRALAALGNIGDFLAQAWESMPPKVKTFVDKVVTFFRDLPARAMAAIGRAGPAIANAAFGGFGPTVSNFVDNVVATFRNLPGRVLSAVGNLGRRVAARLNVVGFHLPFTATGGVFDGAQTRVIAERGPEAVVPLKRPLSQVSPDVRLLSAIAQGKGLPLGSGGGGRTTVFEDGAVRVTSVYADAAEVAEQVMDRLASK